jgi:hypothetical protein
MTDVAGIDPCRSAARVEPVVPQRRADLTLAITSAYGLEVAEAIRDGLQARIVVRKPSHLRVV